MFAVPALFKREANAILLSPIAYVVTSVFLLLSGFFFYIITVSSREPSMRFILDNMGLTLVFVTPMITMRLLAEESKSGTLQTLMTAPVTDFEVVLAKFLAGMLFFCIMLAPTLIYSVILCVLAEPTAGLGAMLKANWGFVTLMVLGCVLACAGYVYASLAKDPVASMASSIGASVVLCVLLVCLIWKGFNAKTAFDWGQMMAGYLGLLLMGALFVSIGLLFSSLTQNQVVAAISTLVVLLLLWVIGWSAGRTEGMLKNVLEYIGLPKHLGSFGKGLIDTRDAIYFLSISAFALFLTVCSVGSRKWR